MRGLVRFLYGAGAAHVSKTGSGQRDPVRFIVLRLYESRLNPATDRVSMFACAMPRPRRVQLGGGSYLEARSSCCSPASPALLLCETLIALTYPRLRSGSGGGLSGLANKGAASAPQT